jgi:hypothetical protein
MMRSLLSGSFRRRAMQTRFRALAGVFLCLLAAAGGEARAR